MPRAAIPGAWTASRARHRCCGQEKLRRSRAASCGCSRTRPRTSPAPCSTFPADASLSRVAYALLGPTASGKSALAIKVAAKLPVEIVSMDSALVYRGMDIGTAKPGAALRARVPHHLIDIVDPDQSYSAGSWRAEAILKIEEILARKNIPLLVGGTMLYYRALIAGLDALRQAGAARRAAKGRSRRRAAHRAERRAAHPARARSLAAHRKAAVRASGRCEERAAFCAEGHRDPSRS